MDALEVIWHGLRNALLMAWAVWWALVFGFAISGIVQAWVPRRRIEGALAGEGAGPLARATGLGAASSSCSYAAIAIARSLFAKGASASTALAFQFASTNLVWELGLVLWVLLGWQFTIAEYLGGVVMIVLMALFLRAFVSPRLERQARRHAELAATGHVHESAGSEGAGWRARLLSADAWADVAYNFRGDWRMLYKEITAGFLLAGFVALLGNDFFNALFVRDASGAAHTLENVLVGPLIAVLSFVCSVGNVPLAAVLWSGGISFAGVLAFLFADLIVLPIVVAYRKYYGTAYALRTTALMFVTMVLAALIVNAVFGGLGLIPNGPRPTRGDIFGAVQVDYKLFLNGAGLVVFATLMALTARRGATDPTCGMTVDRRRAIRSDLGGESHYFCSEGCLHAFTDARAIWRWRVSSSPLRSSGAARMTAPGGGVNLLGMSSTTAQPHQVPLANLLDLSGQTAIVTGGGMGIGLGISRRLHEAGAKVVVADIDIAAAEGVTSALNAERGGSALAVAGDVSDADSVEHMVQGALERFGAIDILVNNAGIYPMVPLRELDLATFRRVIDVNLTGLYLCTKVVAERMIARGEGGRIVNVTSIDALHPSMVGLAHYDASKHGAWGFTKNTALELAPHGIWVNAIAPGGVATPGTGVMDGADMEAFEAMIPMRRMGDPDDIGRAAVFLASELSSYMTGAQIVVDGGRLLA